ncbi:LPS translocon maturation chaperone LptM [Hydrogenophaga pseudoflava]|uniref:LPS translocon maturation chaperone LptM n=1 Tax=Hydrogenophaga pseudoflava TaxID=47421 RepID=UPI0027E5BD82|nr:lipoprotein [Hydrogenophaga pseudoflava]MDQ7743486.1 lipoprotein [Hydrogenophaga pseudoflava]
MSRCSAWSAVALVVASVAFAGCGQKGPLYMPAPKAAKPGTAKPTSGPADSPAAPSEPTDLTTSPAR